MARTTEKRGKWNTNTVRPGIRRETLKNIKNEKYTQQTWIMARELKNVENEKFTLQDMKYGMKTEKREK